MLTQNYNKPTHRSRTLRMFGFVLIFLVGLSGCETPKPWVKPYQRHYLADPIMELDQHPLDSSYMHHVFQAREAARGAEGGAGGGCGCN